jgi:hypothetical protein
MSFNQGIGAQLAIGKESAWGTPVADTMLVNFLSESLASTVTKAEEESLLAAKAVAAYDLTGIKVAGDFSAILKPEAAGFFIKAALGGTDTVTPNALGVTGQYLHTITAQAAASTIPSYTIYVDRKQAVKKYSGAKVDSLKLSAKAGDYVRATVAVKAKDEASGTITSVTPPSKKAYKFLNGTLLFGAAPVEFTSIDFEHSNGMDEGVQTNLTGMYSSEPVQGKRKIAFTIEAPYSAATETIREDYLLEEAVISTAVLHLESPDIIVGTSKYRMDITLSNVAVLEASVNVSGADIISMSIKCEATAVGSTEPISVAIYDDISAAY